MQPEFFRTVGDLITRKTSPKQLMGQSAMPSSRANPRSSIDCAPHLMASISLNLGLLNLLPTRTRRGHIMIMALEGRGPSRLQHRVRRRCCSPGSSP